SNTTLWEFKANSTLLSPIATKLMIFTGTRNGTVYSINESTGSLNWKHETGKNINESFGADADAIYFGAADMFYAIYINGSERWSIEVGNVTSPPTIYNETIYFGTSSRLYAIYTNGTEKFNITINSPVYSCAIYNDTIYFGTSSRLYAIYINGTEKFNITINSPVYSSSIYNDIIYFGTSLGLYAIYTNASEKWNITTNSQVYTQAVDNETVYFGTSDGRAYAIYTNGTEKWNKTIGSKIFYSLSLNREYIYIGTSNGFVYALYKENGTTAWEYLTNGNTTAHAIIRNKLFLASNTTLYCFGTKIKAEIISISPNPAEQGESIRFIGTQKEGWKYLWSSSIDGIIGSVSTFSTSTLSLGKHYISFRVFDENLSTAEDHAEVEIKPTQNWPSFRHDGYNLGHTPSIPPKEPQLLWTFGTKEMIRNSPIFYNDTVYIGSVDGSFYAIDAFTGIKKWSFLAKGPISSSPVIADGFIFLCSDDSKLYALDLEGQNDGDDGLEDYGSEGYDLVWVRGLGAPIWSSPIVVNGRLFVGNVDGNASKLYAINYLKGDIIWTSGNIIKDSIYSSPAVYNSTVYIGSNDKKLYAFDFENGKKKWEFETYGSIWSSPAIYNDTVYFGSWDNNFYALNSSSGALKWKFTAKDWVWSSAAISNDTVYFGSWDNNFYSLNASTGKLRWKFTANDKIDSSPSIACDLVYFGSWDNNIYALNLSNGNVTWKYSIGGDVRSTIVIAKGLIFLSSSDINDKKVYAFGDAPDLNIKEITYKPTAPYVGQVVEIYTKVSNEGSVDAYASFVLYEALPNENKILSKEEISLSRFETKIFRSSWVARAGVHLLVAKVENVTPFDSNNTNNERHIVIIVSKEIGGWRMFKNDSMRSGYIQSSLPNTNISSWVYESYDKIFSSQAVANGKVFIGIGNELVAFNQYSGEKLWSFQTNGKIFSSPAVFEGVVYFGSNDNAIYAIDEAYGKLIWKYSTFGEVSSSPLLIEDNLFIVSQDGYLYSINKLNGTLEWRKYLGNSSYQEFFIPSPAGNEGYVVTAFGSKIFLFNSSSGFEIWNYELKNKTFSTPIIAQEEIIIANIDGVITSIGLDGKVKWKYNTSEEIYSSPSFFANIVYIATKNGSIYALDLSTGKPIWKKNFNDEFVSSPSIGSNGILFCGKNIYALNFSGEKLWSYETSALVYSSPAISNGMVFVGGKKLYAFGFVSYIPPRALIDSPKNNSEFRVGEKIFFSSGSYDVDGKITSYSWDFGDGFVFDTNESFAYHIYDQPGSYNVKLLIYDNDGLSNSSYIIVQIIENYSPILLEWKVSPDEGDIRTLFNFTVLYKDENNDPPTYVDLVINEEKNQMFPYGNEDYKKGRKYFYETYLDSSIHNFHFEASDGLKNVSSPKMSLKVFRTEVFSSFDLILEITYIGLEKAVNITPIPLEYLPAPKNKTVFKAYNISKTLIDVTKVLIKINYSGISQLNISSISISYLDEQDWYPLLSNLNESTGYVEAMIEKNLFLNHEIFALVGKKIPPNNKPVAKAGEDKKVIVGDFVELNGSESYDPDGDELFYYWDFGDNEFGEGKVVKHKYSKPGKYHVVLRVDDGRGGNSTDEVIITAQEKGGMEVLFIIIFIVAIILGIALFLPHIEKGEKIRVKKDIEELEEMEKEKEEGKEKKEII
ncbi:MAG: PQQ-binding-like beta-propeller repeat protein, partial [Candidatus Thermoplasmatota archaeon]